MAVDCVGIQPVDHLNPMFQLSTNDFNVSSSYNQPVKRTGHARFRCGPSSSSADAHGPSTSSPSENRTPKECFSNRSVTETTVSSRSTSSSSTACSSAGGGLEGSVLSEKQFSSLGILTPAPTFSSRKPPLPSTHQKRCSPDRPIESVHISGTSYQCCKRRIGSKRDIRRVPIMGSKVTSIPADDYSWKKYGEKRIEGSPYPRVSYKCGTGKGCPARKRVEFVEGDSKMFLVTYDGEHRHRLPPASLTGVVVR